MKAGNSPMTSNARRLLSVLGIGLVLALGAGEADAARRGGSFGSRGMRTYQAPRATETAPRPGAPIERSMTPRTPAGSQAQAQTQAARNAAPGAQQRGGFLQRWGGPILGGLLAAGLFGMLMGNGFGGAAGMMAMLLQVGAIALLAMLAMRFFRRRQSPALAGAPDAASARFQQFTPGRAGPEHSPGLGLGLGAAPGRAPTRDGDEIGVTDADFDTFERMLGEIQTGFGRADFDALRSLTTPEAMSYLAEELSRNAADGLRNEIREVKLLQGDLSEAWREAEADYATVAMRFSSIDVTRDASGRVVAGDPAAPTETTELWTFVRARGPWGARWLLAAIQDV